MPRAERTEVDGVPIFWRDFGDELATVGLAFRVGVADETLQTHGLTHLIEHMALAMGERRFTYEGTVDDIHTVLLTRGTRDQVKEFLETVTHRISSPELDSIPVHARVLRTEAAGRQQGWGSIVKGVRFGPRAFGLSHYIEAALHWVDSPQVLEWSRNGFSAENAVVWMTCPPPAGLRLHLGTGHRMPTPDPQPRELPYPAYLTWDQQGVAMSFFTDFSPSMLAGFSILKDVAAAEVRHRRGISYNVDVDWTMFTPEKMHIGLAADSLEENVLQLREAILSVVGRLATEGPTDEEMGSMIHLEDQIRLASSDPSLLQSEAVDELIGRGFQAPEELGVVLGSLSPKEIARSLGAAFQTALMVAPQQLEPPAGWNQPTRFRPSVTGRSFSPARRASHVPLDARLTVGSEGVSISSAGFRDTQLFVNCAAVGWDSQHRVIIGWDGSFLVIDRGHWRHGPEAIALVDASVPSDLFYPMEGSAPGPRIPPGVGEVTLQRQKKRWWSPR